MLRPVLPRIVLFFAPATIGCSALVAAELQDKPSESPPEQVVEDASTDISTMDQAAEESGAEPEAQADAGDEADGGVDAEDARSEPEASVDAEQDANPCGEGCDPALCCGNTCCEGTTCLSPDQCSSSTCAAGYWDCNQDMGDGCEANVNADPNNCGTCAHACLTGRQCGGGQCSPAWAPVTSSSQPEGRESACAVWTGSKLFVWGGRIPATTTLLASGALYDPGADSWVAVSTTGAPSARARPVCVWTGDRVVVWSGGTPGETPVVSGAVYDPAADTWTAMQDASVGRVAPVAVWTGSHVLLWGGSDGAGGQLKSGELYDPNANTWQSMDPTGAPATNIGMGYAWAETNGLLAFGGSDGTKCSLSLFQYQLPPTDHWVKLKDINPAGFSARQDAFVVWADNKLLIWGGRDFSKVPQGNGVLFDPVPKTWTVMPSIPVGAHARAQVAYESGWTGSAGALVWFFGGLGDADVVEQGGLAFDASKSQWDVIPGWNPAGEHARGVGAWTGSEFIVWGGVNAAQQAEMDGSRWLP